MFARLIVCTILSALGLAAFSGCTTDDRDYLRNHVAVENKAVNTTNLVSEASLDSSSGLQTAHAAGSNR